MKSRLHPSIDPRCPKCHGDGYLIERDGEHAVAVRCDAVGRCPHCRDTGWIAASKERRARKSRCSCGVLAQRIKAFNEAKIPARHYRSTLVTWDSSGTGMIGFSAANAYKKAWDPEADNRGLVLYGDVGRGKTHLLVALLRDLIFEQGVTARFVEFSHLVGDIKAGFDVGRGTHALLDPLVRVDVLAIDELGKGRNTEFEGTIVDELVSRRYNAASVILATTNYGPGATTGRAASNFAAKNAAPTLPDRVGDRVYSRLREMCDFVQCQGSDYRDAKRHARR